MRHVFVLGCERSGSTWLANILDAHPEVELWMEPFADYAGLFPAFPGRTVHVERPGPELVHGVRDGIGRLPTHKYPLLYRRGRRTGLQSVDRAIARGIARTARWLHAGTPRWVQRFELLNLNASEADPSLRVRKARQPSVYVTKELRLSFAVGLLTEVFDDPRFIAIVRHPLTQVASMLRWIERGRLRELVRSLPRFRDALAAPGRLHRYAPLAKVADDTTALLAAYWVASYGTLLGDLRASGRAHVVLRHEDLCAAPDARAGEILRFCGLGDSPAVARYLNASTRTGAPEPSSPLDTMRHSRSTPDHALAEVPEHVRDRVSAVLEAATDEGLIEPDLAYCLGGSRFEPGEMARDRTAPVRRT